MMVWYWLVAVYQIKAVMYKSVYPWWKYYHQEYRHIVLLQDHYYSAVGSDLSYCFTNHLNGTVMIFE